MAQLVDQGVPFVGLMAFYCILYIYIYKDFLFTWKVIHAHVNA